MSTTISSATVLLVEAVRDACSFTFLCLRLFSVKRGGGEGGREREKRGRRKEVEGETKSKSLQHHSKLHSPLTCLVWLDER